MGVDLVLRKVERLLHAAENRESVIREERLRTLKPPVRRLGSPAAKQTHGVTRDGYSNDEEEEEEEERSACVVKRVYTIQGEGRRGRVSPLRNKTETLGSISAAGSPPSSLLWFSPPPPPPPSPPPPPPAPPGSSWRLTARPVLDASGRLSSPWSRPGLRKDRDSSGIIEAFL